VTVLVALALLEGSSRFLEPVLDRVVPLPEHGRQFVTTTNPMRVFQLEEGEKGETYTRTEDHWIPRGQSFAARKSPSTVRVFCLGGSASNGWPHPWELSYPALLEAKLRALYPDHTIEVLNLGGNTYASYRVKIVFDEIIEYQPDLVLVYCGHNEFLENVVYIPTVLTRDKAWERLALGRLVRRAVETTRRGRGVIDLSSYDARDQVASRLSFAFGKASEMRGDPEQLRMVREHFRFNLAWMVTSCRSRGVGVALITAPVNLKHWSPNVSLHRKDLSEDDVGRWQVAYRSGVLALEDGHWERAAVALTEAAEIDSEHAETWFQLGSALRRLNRPSEAKAAYQQALLLDAFPFRSIFNPDVRDIADRHGVPLVDAVAALEGESRDGIVGLGRLVDYVHPTAASNEIIAHEVVTTLLEHGLLPAKPAVPVKQTRIHIPPREEDDLDTLRALFGQFLIMRQYGGLERIANRLQRAIRRRHAVASVPEKAGLERLLGRVDETMTVIRPYRQLLRAEKLGILDEEFTRAEAQAVFGDYVEFIRRTEDFLADKGQFKMYIPDRGFGATP
jgi:tetratricopeptide (TPR) repeat protein